MISVGVGSVAARLTWLKISTERRLINESTSSQKVSIRADLSAFLAFAAITTCFAGFRFYYDNWLTDFDIYSYFLPAFGYLGDRLRDFDVPAWNPYFSGGQPHAGDPGGGWMFLPAMIGFTLFDAASGFKAMVLIELLTAGSATYFFCRRIGMIPVSAMVGALALSTGPMIYGSTSYVTIIGQITPFLALGMLATECALQTDRLSSRLAWSSLAGVAVIQTFLSWPQGFMYTVMLIGAWMTYRWLFAPGSKVASRRILLIRIVISGITMSISALAFGAAGILPRLDFSRQSNIPGGDYDKVIGGNYAAATWPAEQIGSLFIQNTQFWRPIQINAVVVVLAVLAVLIGRNRFGIPLFAVSAAIFLDLSVQHSLTRWAFYLVPGFEHLHSHRPTSGISMIFFPVAVLAAGAIHLLLENRREHLAWLRRIVPLVLYLLLVWRVNTTNWPISWLQVSLAAIGTVLIAVPLISLPGRWQKFYLRIPRFAVGGLIVTMLIFPNLMDIVATVHDPENKGNVNDSFGREDVLQEIIGTSMARTDPGSAAEFLQQKQSEGQFFRYAPYFGTGSPDTSYVASSSYRLRPWAVASLMNPRAARLGLEQVGGYNPIHLLYYTEYMAVLNGSAQDYHWLDLYMAALEQSPLLDMLNVRYVIVPVELPKPVPIAEWGVEVYRDDLVVVYENPNVYDRAWIVHEVRPALDGTEIDLFNDGSVDGRQVAFVDGDLPAVNSGDGADAATVIATSPESVTIRTSSSADGLLVLSDSYADGWNAYVDGEKTEVLRTNHAFRGIALPAGEHQVIFRYEPRSLEIGLWTTGFGSVALIGIWSWALVDFRRRKR